MYPFHFILFPILFILLSGTIFWVWVLIDCLTNEPNSSDPNNNNSKILWVLVITLTHWIGAIIYVLVRRPQRIKETGR